MALTSALHQWIEYDEDIEHNRIRRTPFIINLPDSNLTQVDIQKMLEAGMNILRIGMSTTTVTDRRHILKLLRMASNTMCQKYAISEWPVATWLDLKNCMVRTGSLEEVDIIGISYVCHAETVRQVQLCLKKTAHRPLILSDICTEDGLENIDDIIKESDGIAIPSDILPYELETARRFRWMQIQNWIISKCEQAGKPCFLTGGILQDATSASKTLPFNEVFDVANAVIDGISGFVLKNCVDIETTIEHIKDMDKLCCGIEPFIETNDSFRRQADEIKMPVNAAEACMLACIAAAIQSAATIIVIPTVTGTTVRQLARMRLPCLVITLSTSSRVNRMLHVYRSVKPLKYTATGKHRSFAAEVEERINYAIDFAVAKGYLQFGDYYVTLSRDSEASAYCDCVATCRTHSHKQPLVSCDE